MRLRLLVTFIVLLALSFSFVDDEKSPTGPGTSLSLSDLESVWTGEARNSYNIISLHLTVASEGVVSGHGYRQPSPAFESISIYSQWTINAKGEVTGDGSFSLWTEYIDIGEPYDRRVHAIAVDSKGNIWSGTDGG